MLVYILAAKDVKPGPPREPHGTPTCMYILEYIIGGGGGGGGGVQLRQGSVRMLGIRWLVVGTYLGKWFLMQLLSWP